MSKSDDQCYMCERLATGMEHVPARGFFPRMSESTDGVDYRQQLMTVPSCDVHNTEKSKDDEYFRFVVLSTLSVNEVGRSLARSAVRRSITRRPRMAMNTYLRADFAWIFDFERGRWESTLIAPIESDRLHTVLEWFARALYFFHFRQRWSESVYPLPQFLELDSLPVNTRKHWRGLLRQTDADTMSVDRHGKNPRVFYYQVLEDPTPEGGVLIKATFYEGAPIVILFPSAHDPSPAPGVSATFG